MNLLSDFISLFFPRICASCGNSLWTNETCVCHACEFRLPKTGFHLDPLNPVAELFTGRADLLAASAFLYFNKGGSVQRLVHQLKYKGRKDIGVWMGKRYGSALKETPPFNTANLIIPVPLHKKKYMKRGYNQSEQFAIGLSFGMQIPVARHLLLRTRATETQTRKSRFARHQNVREVFRVDSPEKWSHSHLLLVDDVVTTGATIESCISALQMIPGVKISVVCVAAALR